MSPKTCSCKTAAESLEIVTESGKALVKHRGSRDVRQEALTIKNPTLVARKDLLDWTNDFQGNLIMTWRGWQESSKTKFREEMWWQLRPGTAVTVCLVTNTATDACRDQVMTLVPVMMKNLSKQEHSQSTVSTESIVQCLRALSHKFSTRVVYETQDERRNSTKLG